MILFTLLRIGWINITRDRVVQAMVFLLPMMFFSIFATVFGNQSDPTSRIRVAVVDEDKTEYSAALIKALEAEGGLRVQQTATAVFKAGPVAADAPPAEQPGQLLDHGDLGRMHQQPCGDRG